MSPVRIEERGVNKFLMRHLMLHEFQKHNNATNAINTVYPGALNIAEYISVSLKSFLLRQLSTELEEYSTSKSPSFCKKKVCQTDGRSR